MTHPFDTPSRQTSRPSTDSSSVHHVLPGSPTLTNPDMILPDYDEPESPPEIYVQQPLDSWQDTEVSDATFQMKPQQPFIAGPVTPATPIIYGNGTMLSDIGEVTEVESNAGNDYTKRTIVRFPAQNGGDGALRPSPVMGQHGIHRRTRSTGRERRMSVESTDTITIEDKPYHFADFDDSVSIDDSNFQGDDEQSMASSFRDDGGAGARDVATRRVHGGGEERYSTHISKRAEEILANAKKRLTTMEGNLSKARSSLTSPSESASSTPSPPGLRSSTAMRLSNRRNSPAHSRDTSSENSSSSNPRANIIQRSASALGAAGGYRQPVSNSPHNSRGGVITPTYKITHAPLDPPIEMPGELDNASDLSGMHHDRQGSGNSATLGMPSGISPNMYLEAGHPRATSVSQMRDLQDQMKGLKGKISTLREKAIADSMKRRSLQSLRTPSPFTHARFENGLMEPSHIKKTEIHRPISTEPIKPLPIEENKVEKDEGTTQEDLKQRGDLISDSEVLTNNEALPIAQMNSPQEPITRGHIETKEEQLLERFPDHSTAELAEEAAQFTPGEALDNAYQEGEYGEENPVEEANDVEDNDDEEEEEEEEEEDFADGRSESSESMYVDTQPGLSHEDRDDAFDYEHFFLHSAMGSMSRRANGDTQSWGSYDSDDSVETTRGPEHHQRRPSTGTISSVNTFATAREGQESRTSARSRPDTRQSSEWANESGEFQDQEFPDEEFRDEDQARASFGMESVGMSDQRGSKETRGSTLHRPSVSSMESTGTTRSFPLLNRPKSNGAQMTPVSSPDPETKRVSRMLLGDTARMLDHWQIGGALDSEAVQTLAQEDQVAVQMLVASLGSCIVGMGNTSTSSSSMQTFRQRLEVARRILEGQRYG